MLSTFAQYNQAIEYYERALAIDIKAFGHDHRNVAIYRNNLRLEWKPKGKYDKAIKYHKLSFKSFEKTNLPHKAKTFQKIISSLKKPTLI